MYCSKCGKRNEDKAAFCIFCGAKLTEDKNLLLASLVIRMQNGDMEAFNEFYDQTQKYIRFVAYQKTENSETTEDVVQEVYTAIFQNIHTLENPAAAWGWVKTIARNTAVNVCKKEAKYVLMAEEESEDFFADIEEEDVFALPEDAPENKELQKILGKMVDELPPMQRQVIVDFFYNDQKESEIAENMGISLTTVKGYVHRGKKKLKEKCIEYSRRTGVRLRAMPLAPVFYEVLRDSIQDTAATSAVPAGIARQIAAGMKGTAAAAAGAKAAAAGTKTATAGTKTAAAGKKTAAVGNAVKGATAKTAVTKAIAGIAAAAVVGTGTVAYVTHDRREVKAAVVGFEEACRAADEEAIEDCFVKKDALTIDKYRVHLADAENTDFELIIHKVEIDGDHAKVFCSYQKKKGYLNLTYEEKEWKLVMNSVNRNGIKLWTSSSSIKYSDLVETELIYNDDE